MSDDIFTGGVDLWGVDVLKRPFGYAVCNSDADNNNTPFLDCEYAAFAEIVSPYIQRDCLTDLHFKNGSRKTITCDYAQAEKSAFEISRYASLSQSNNYRLSFNSMIGTSFEVRHHDFQMAQELLRFFVTNAFPAPKPQLSLVSQLT